MATRCGAEYVPARPAVPASDALRLPPEELAVTVNASS
jgi:hypothetical protein